MNITMKHLENVACEAKAEGFQLIIEVMTPGLTVPEVIINRTENIDGKMEYYRNAYTEDLKLKNNENVYITKAYAGLILTN